MPTIRPADISDLDAITEIYNEAILTTTATFDTQPKSAAEQASWFEGHGGRHPILVAQLDGAVVGWASLSEWSDRCAYSDTAEISLYVKSEHRNRGIGRELGEAIIEAGRRTDLHSLVARIAEGSDASIHLHERLGFEHAGTLKQVGRKFGKLLDVHNMQKMLRDE